MALETATDVEQIRAVQDSDGTRQSPSNEAMQEAVLAAIEALDDQNATKQDAIEAAVQAVEADVESVDTAVQAVETAVAAVETDVETVAETVGNQPGVGAFTHSTSGTTAESLPANPVPDGVEVVVQARPDNTDPVYIGDSAEQAAIIEGTQAVTLAVEDTSAIHVRTPTAGDTVGVLFEEA
jgi:hypothetical protein